MVPKKAFRAGGMGDPGRAIVGLVFLSLDGPAGDGRHSSRAVDGVDEAMAGSVSDARRESLAKWDSGFGLGLLELCIVDCRAPRSVTRDLGGPDWWRFAHRKDKLLLLPLIRSSFG